MHGMCVGLVQWCIVQSSVPPQCIHEESREPVGAAIRKQTGHEQEDTLIASSSNIYIYIIA